MQPGTYRNRQGVILEIMSVPMFNPMAALKSGHNRLTGISLGQVYAYIRWFPNERPSLRAAVSIDSDPQWDRMLINVGIDYTVTARDCFLFPKFTDLNLRAINLFYSVMSVGVVWQQFIFCRRNSSYACVMGGTW